MSKRDHNGVRPKKRNPHARSLEDPMFRQRKIKSMTGYNRSDFKSVDVSTEDDNDCKPYWEEGEDDEHTET